MRIVIQNDDNLPVKFSQAMVQLAPVTLLVKDRITNQPFQVLWGNSKLTKPAYDVEKIIEQTRIDVTALPVISLDHYSLNSQYSEPQLPLTERYPYLLTIALAIAILVVGIIQFKSIKKIES